MVGMETMLFSILGHFSGCVSCSNYAVLCSPGLAALRCAPLCELFVQTKKAMRRAHELC
jgi:hypothetical protein